MTRDATGSSGDHLPGEGTGDHSGQALGKAVTDSAYVGYDTEPAVVSGGPISIELSQSQVDQIVRDAAGTGNMSVLLSGLHEVRGTLSAEPKQMDDSRLSRSLLQGLLLLAAFPADGSYLSNADAARALGMNASTVHRYMSTLTAAGLVERDPGTRKYRLAQ